MVRPATISDVSKIRLLMQSAPGFWQTWWSDETVADAIQASNGPAFVWEDTSRILGFVCGHDLGFRAYLSELGWEAPDAMLLRKRLMAAHGGSA
jgi:hypothetical protein